MFTNISWSDYIIAVAILLTIYYFFVGARYYSADLKDQLSGKRKLKFRAALPIDSGEEDTYPPESYQNKTTSFETNTDDDFAEVEHLIERLKNMIADASQKKLIPQEFKQYLHLLLKEYPSVKNSPLRSSVNELVVSECEKYGAVTLSEDEVDMLWKDAM
ncbi:hypothetical protein J7E50_19605 [Pedobacter sp. ISL-68]|uniref:hypothetical protein n=1 Tax=unclassified Pedobacter TaxID=2628915 RepID=UPI001BEBE34E|nr:MULTISPECIES: hypothetical protein [unclassified Pedobacter]MBT2564677.1 hypothetical protein [Pedobacter sp. ISL-64]MBT2592434.1 hypothetical protein [Pedobacter sp. ISL-68]